MHVGWTISLTLHAILIALALFGSDLFRRDRDDLRQVATVSLISAADFDAGRQSTPEPDLGPEVAVPELDPLVAPETEADAGEAPDADAAPVATIADFVADPSAADTEADLSALTEQIAQPDVATDVEALTEAAPEAPSFSMPGLTGMDSINQAPRAPSLNRPPSPVQAPRIAGTESPKPPTPDKPADVAQDATVPSQDEAETADAQERTVEEESTTAASPVDPSGEEDGIALRRASAPRARPRDFAEQIALAVAQAEREAREAEEARLNEEIARLEREQREREERARREEEERQAAQAAEVAAAVAAAQGDSTTTAPVGPPLTAGEKDGLRLAVQRCWIIPAGLPNSSDLRVVVGVDLDPDGRIVGDTELLEPRNSDRTEIRVAYEAARRALFRCQGAGYDLPREKYEQWKRLEVGFNPEGMLARW